MEMLFIGSASYLVIGLFVVLSVVLVLLSKLSRKRNKIVDNVAPGPTPWPIIGSLHLLAAHELPYQALDALATKYGPVASLRLGQVQCLVVSSLQHVKEVLLSKGDHFDGRPDFMRYHKLFSGDKQNSLAFCDWSEVQKIRRDMLKAHTFPRAFTQKFHLLDSLLNDQIVEMFSEIQDGTPTAIKPLVLNACANVFLNYFCSSKFSNKDKDFVKLVRNFDYIFYEVNQGYAADFIPWLMPLHKWHLSKLAVWSHEIREFVVEKIISKRMEFWTRDQEQEDYIDALLEHVHGDKASMTLDTALFALEDIVGGHSAVANFLVKVLGMIADKPAVQAKVQQEVDSVTGGCPVTLADRGSMPYTEAVILETIRHISSPIVPHVANQTSSVGGFTVEKGTLIFLNNYTLNMSPELWDEPNAFMPERFLNSEGRLTKPEHFLPFGGGRRSCMGYKMTQFVSFSLLASLLQRYSLTPSHELTVPLGNLALPYDTFKFNFTSR